MKIHPKRDDDVWTIKTNKMQEKIKTFHRNIMCVLQIVYHTFTYCVFYGSLALRQVNNKINIFRQSLHFRIFFR